MRWMAPLERRELMLILFALTVFFFAFNIDNSIRLLGFDPEAAHGVVSSTLGFGNSKLIGKDGRKLPGWRDGLENDIFGSWGWDEGHIAGDGEERSQVKDTGKYGALWAGQKETGEVTNKFLGETTVNQGFWRWRDDIPQSKVVQHVPGFTILDNVFISNGTVYVVTDDLHSVPAMSSIIAAVGLGMNSWEVISVREAKTKLGQFGGIVRGVSWMSADTTPHNSTLISLWRMYSSLDHSIDQLGRTTLPPPNRIIFPQLPVFTDPNPLPHFHWIRRRRVDTGFHPYLLKAAFPQLTVMYQDDWEDYHKLQFPFVIERIVVADREAAEAAVHLGQPSYAPPFELEASEFWWEPVRRTLVEYLGEAEGKPGSKVVTYLHRQGEKTGLRLRDEDHQDLVGALKGLGRARGYDVHIVSSVSDETPWGEKLRAIVKSSVVLGVHGSELLDSMFMKPSPHATLMEFFPVGTFSREEELAVHSRGINYIAWWHDRKFTIDDLPSVVRPGDQEFRIDSESVVNAIRDVFTR